MSDNRPRAGERVIILGDPAFHWGIVPDKPFLPPGYLYIEEARWWLLAEAPSGRRYYVARHRKSGAWSLYRQGVAAVTLKYYVDIREEVSLPQLQLT